MQRKTLSQQKVHEKISKSRKLSNASSRISTWNRNDKMNAEGFAQRIIELPLRQKT